MSRSSIHNDIQQIQIGYCRFWMEPGWLFINGERFNFKWLADGGMIYWLWNTDCDAAISLRILEPSHVWIITLKTILFERGILNV